MTARQQGLPGGGAFGAVAGVGIAGASAPYLWDALVQRWTSVDAMADRGDGQGPIGHGGRGAKGAAGSTVLVVVDEPQMLEAMTEALSERGHRVVACRDAGEGLGALSLIAGPAVLVTDVNLHGFSGLDLAEAFRAVRRDGGVVFITGLTQVGTMPDAFGARDVLLRKPFGADDLRAAVSRAAACGANAPTALLRRPGRAIPPR